MFNLLRSAGSRFYCLSASAFIQRSHESQIHHVEDETIGLTPTSHTIDPKRPRQSPQSDSCPPCPTCPPPSHHQKFLVPEEKWEPNWDRMGTETAAKSQVMRRLIFIRHGDYNKTSSTKELNDLGKKQSERAGKRLSELYQSRGLQLINTVTVSPINRAKETWQIIKQNIKTNGIIESETDLLREGYPCLTEPPVKQQKKPYTMFSEVARMEAGYRFYVHRPLCNQRKTSTDLYVCHGNVIRYFLMRALQLPPQYWLRLNIENASLTEVNVFSNGYVSVKTMGEKGHLVGLKRCQ